MGRGHRRLLLPLALDLERGGKCSSSVRTRGEVLDQVTTVAVDKRKILSLLKAYT